MSGIIIWGKNIKNGEIQKEKEEGERKREKRKKKGKINAK
jgi:hypothetical protein